MSTWLYLECLDHDPPLRADMESGQHLYDLPQIRQDIADRDALITEPTEHDHDNYDPGPYFRVHSRTFLKAHPKCRIGIVSEYGVEYPTDGGAA